MWSYWLCDTFTGARLRVHPASGTWRTVINGIGSGTLVCALRDPELKLPRETWREWTRPWAYTVVAAFDDVPVYAGVITRRQYQRATGLLTLSWSDVRIIMGSRYQYVIYGHDPQGSFRVEGRSLRGTARAVLSRAFLGVGGDWDLPIILPPDEAGSETREWFAYRFQSTEQMLREVQDADNGPDVYLQPAWTPAGTLQWAARLGAPRLTGPLLEVHGSAGEASALDLSEVTDGAKQLTGIWMQGEGSEVDMRLGRAGDGPGFVGPRIPNLDAPVPAKSVSDTGQLDSLARAEWRARRSPTEQVELGVLASAALPTLVLGSTVRVWVYEDDFMLDGKREGYVIGMSGTVGSEMIGVEFQ